MRRIDTLPRGIERCAVLPQKTDDKGGFVDTGSRVVGLDPSVFVSATAVREMGRELGFPTPEAHAEAVGRAEALEETLAAANTELEELRRFRDSIDVLESADFRARKKVGRPKKEQS